MADPVHDALAPTANAATAATAPSPRDGAVALIIGEKLAGRYLVQAFLGEGGMGAVYRALDEQLGEEVALKVVRGTSVAAMLRDEVRLAQKVTHANVCRTYDLEEAGGHYFVKMEYVAGETLAARLARNGKLAIDEAVRIANAVADGLAAAHAKRIVHRDLKPGNVMIADGRVVLMDFGIARQLTTASDSVAGTVGYMAPEQLEGGTVDERADLYALGCVLYEMLAGTPAGKAPRDLRSVRPEVPRWLARATMGLMAHDRVHRTAALARLRIGPRSLWRVAAPALAVVAIGSLIAWRVTRHEPWTAHVIDLPQLDENGDTPSFSPDGKRILFSSDRYTPNQFHTYVMNVDGTDVRRALPESQDAWWARFTADGRGILFGRPMVGTMARLDVANGTIAELGRGGSPVPCGDAIAFLDPDHADALSLLLPSGERRVLFEARSGGWIGPASCDASGTRIAFTYGDRAVSAAKRDVYVVDRDRNVTQLTHGTSALLTVSTTPDGHSVVYVSEHDHHRRLYEVALATGATHQLTLDDDWDAAPDISRDGSRLVFDRDTTAENLWTGGQDDPPHRVTFDRGTVQMPRETARPGVIVAQQAEGDHWNIVAIDTRDNSERVLTRGNLPVGARDGTVYFFDGPTLSAVSLDGGPTRAIAHVPGSGMEIYAVDDGLHVIVESADHAFQTLRIAPASGHVDGSEPGWNVPAPSGGWRLEVVPGRPVHLRVLAAGASNGRELTSYGVVPVWIDDHRFAYCLHDRCRIENVDGTLDHELTAPRAFLDTGAIVSSDGKRWYATTAAGNVTRHIIDNFGARPWRD
jgi:Tol biopolymer transport system component/predicted Ser/Thr protein kinase